MLGILWSWPVDIQKKGRMSWCFWIEGQYASFGVANQRYKDQHLYSTSMGLEEYQAAYAEWQSKVAG